MHVLATAGHVDHGKSALVRALTGIEPDRWEEEHRRGLTIDLGYAWTTLPSGEQVAFVDVPGHQRFIGNMLAGLGPAPAVVFVVAADEGWRQQSGEHLAAVDALGLRHGLLVVTRSDLADPAATLADARERLAASSLGHCAAVAVSARTGEGMPQLRAALDRLVASMPAPDPTARVRLWVDRAFSIKGSGTVVTGTLGEGTIRVGDELEVDGRRVRVRGLQSLERPRESVAPVARVAVNLRGVGTDEVARGSVLVASGAWPTTAVVDVRLGTDPRDLPARAMLHVGTAAHEVRVRPLAGDVARLTLPVALPLRAGDRAILRDPGAQRVVAGVLVVDADPPPLARRGAGARRGEELAAATGELDLAREVARRGAMAVSAAGSLGLAVPGDGAELPESVVRERDWLVDRRTWQGWARALRTAVQAQAAADPLDPTLTVEAAREAVQVPDRALVGPLAVEAGLQVEAGRVRIPGVSASLGGAEEGLRRIEERLSADPFAAPERPDLEAAGLGPRQVAAAVRAGRLLRLPDDVLLLPSGPARAMRVLAGLPQPFTLSEARQALGTTRRVAVPLLEHLDGRGWTRRVDASHREVVR
ncbi:selenocysteine-specific translation elongation factor [Knoellia sp. p5-6-4]|uniref:selenocysteine-specific translation elongation factor n=1 Tax=unclassified Knoellia TaxID=2618719 RepID=UPI0023DB6D0F|nr:selenocysteine-specific translation elongation factor [Knoellia sp. p5-6-4]MDF2143853.1 selenocysteine-specific translation elongation factor [Knoellia sp. p5-6-4]